MQITLYFINWNDAFYLPFIKQHYGQFCQKIVMYDNHSTDGSQELAKSLGFEVREFGYRGILNDQWYLDVKNHCWKEERGKSDYVIVCDADEFLEFKGNPTVSCPTVTGYNMVSDHLPEKSIYDIKTGSYSENYSKQVIFCPTRIEEINYVHGCHKNWKTGEITTGDEMKMYHLRQIGGAQRTIERHADYQKRMSSFNLKHGMGAHYLHSAEQKRIEFEYLKSQAVELW